MPTGQQSPVLIKDCSFSRYICLVFSVAQLKTCPLEFSSLTFWPWQSWQAADPSRVLHNKTFFYHVVLCRHKRAPLHPSTRLFTPVLSPADSGPLVLLSHMELWEVLRCGTKKSHNPSWITSCLWSLKWSVSLALSLLFEKKKKF